MKLLLNLDFGGGNYRELSKKYKCNERWTRIVNELVSLLMRL